MITTRNPEEADVLSDYIFIMSKGSIVCHGTSVKLKKEHSSGYILKLSTNESFKSSNCISVVRQYVPKAKVGCITGTTYTVWLPYQSLDSFPTLLRKLEANDTELGIVAVNVTNSSIEDVMNNGDDENMVLHIDGSNRSIASTASKHVSFSAGDDDAENNGIFLRVRKLFESMSLF